MRKVGKVREGWKVGKRKKGERWEKWDGGDGKVEGLKSWKRDRMKESGGLGERMILGERKKGKGMKGGNQIQIGGRDGSRSSF
jgi:hypothetical protein